MARSPDNRGKTTAGKAIPPYRVRASRIHGKGVFATRPIRKGTRIIEYRGERISPEEADKRYEKAVDPGHVVVFEVDEHTAIDAGRGGNEARFVNHSCDPNCESVIEDGRVFIEAIRHIQKGEELSYDYMLHYSGRRTRAVEQQYACHCDSENCRGTMLAPHPRRRRPRTMRRARS
jgi:SET domain-containing protein